MSEQEFAKQLTAAARIVARTELKLRSARKKLAELEDQLYEAKRQLRHLVAATEPYTAPTPAELAAARERLPE